MAAQSEMHEKVRHDILAVLKQALDVMKKDPHPSHLLMDISNRVIHNASIFQDEDSLGAAIMLYALAKTVQGCCEKNVSFGPLSATLRKAYDQLQRGDDAGYRAAAKQLLMKIKQMDSRLKLYVEEVMNAARLKKGHKLHEHGLSVARIAELTGVSQWELLQYMGKTVTYVPEGKPVLQRLQKAREMFR